MNTSETTIIAVRNASKIFRHRKSRALLRDSVRGWAAETEEGFYAVRDASFSIDAGESVALVGANGAGKSTMLSLICGLARPDEGTVEVSGHIAPLLDFGSGFHPDLTGRENLFLNAAFLGMTQSQAKGRYNEIVAFAELEEFIDEPLRTYSAGMTMRLAFAVAIHCDPSIVVIDEVLGVGDAAFQKKCHERIMAMRTSGKTLICVSHSPGLVLDLCARAIWFHFGQIVIDGPAHWVTEHYLRFMEDPTQPIPAGLRDKPIPLSPAPFRATPSSKRKPDKVNRALKSGS